MRGNLRMYVNFKLRLQEPYSSYADVVYIILMRNSKQLILGVHYPHRGGVQGLLTCFPILNCIRECYEQLSQVSDRYLKMQGLAWFCPRAAVLLQERIETRNDKPVTNTKLRLCKSISLLTLPLQSAFLVLIFGCSSLLIFMCCRYDQNWDKKRNFAWNFMTFSWLLCPLVEFYDFLWHLWLVDTLFWGRSWELRIVQKGLKGSDVMRW